MFFNIVKIKFILLVLLLTGISVFFVSMGITGKSEFSGRTNQALLEKRLRQIFLDCNKSKNKTLSSQDFHCLGVGFAPLVQKDNLEVLMKALVSMYSTEPRTDVFGIASCHLPAHLIGSKAVTKGLSFNEIFKACGTNCSYGCLHGAYSENFSKDQNFLTDFTDNCSRYLINPSTDDLHSCWHITGHWLGELLRNNVDTAIKDCMKFPEANGGQDYCISGLRMELLVGSPPKNLSATILTDLTTQQFCSKFPEKYRAECFSESGFYTYRAFADIKRTVENCNSIPVAYKKACATSAGVAYYFSSKDSAARVVDFCKAFGTDEKYCIFGALEISVSEANFYNTAIDICNLEKDKFGKECFAKIGSEALILNGKEFKAKICGNLSPTDKASCETSGGIN